ncbi:hypothetical protein M758_8G068900 [Ceratodon purpureus]|nr:hypothetical protein M758_8G068900 [Ceratodon purpureus]
MGFGFFLFTGIIVRRARCICTKRLLLTSIASQVTSQVRVTRVSDSVVSCVKWSIKCGVINTTPASKMISQWYSIHQVINLYSGPLGF